MNENRKRPKFEFLILAIAVLLPAYALSFGLACWICNRTGIGRPIVAGFYRPIAWPMNSGRLPRFIDKPYREFYLWWNDMSE